MYLLSVIQAKDFGVGKELCIQLGFIVHHLRSSFLQLQASMVCLVIVQSMLEGVGVQTNGLEARMKSHTAWCFWELSTSLLNL